MKKKVKFKISVRPRPPRQEMSKFKPKRESKRGKKAYNRRDRSWKNNY